MSVKDIGSQASMELQNSLLTAERIWFKCNLYLQFVPPMNVWKICIDLRSFSKCFRVPVLTSFHLEFSSFWISRLFDLNDLSVLKNGTRKHFENGPKSIQIFQRVMEGMNRW